LFPIMPIETECKALDQVRADRDFDGPRLFQEVGDIVRIPELGLLLDRVEGGDASVGLRRIAEIDGWFEFAHGQIGPFSRRYSARSSRLARRSEKQHMEFIGPGSR